MTVIDFASRSFWKALEKRFDLLRAHINYGGVTRHMAAANQTASDPISMNGETQEAVSELFSLYGFPTEPKTWAELRAPHAYIERLERGVTLFRVGYRHIPEHGVEFLRTAYSDVFDAAMLVIAGDFKKLAAYHRRHRTCERLVRDYDELAELADGDLADPGVPEG